MKKFHIYCILTNGEIIEEELDSKECVKSRYREIFKSMENDRTLLFGDNMIPMSSVCRVTLHRTIYPKLRFTSDL
jgi:hypothetical protein